MPAAGTRSSPDVPTGGYTAAIALRWSLLAGTLRALTDAQIIEIVQHVALNTWTNFVNSVAQTKIDFPVVATRKVA